MTSMPTSGVTMGADETLDGPIVDDFPSEPPPDLGPAAMIDCRDTPPDGAELPPPLPIYEGSCPDLEPGLNVIESSGEMREFLYIVPEDLQPDERLPVAFLWHWLGGDADSFLEEGDVQAAVNQFRFAAVIPEAKGDLPFRWPFTILDAEPRVEEEFRFFDDMLACVAEEVEVEPNCISSVGVSAGALFTGQLGSGRGHYLSSILSLSGGTGGTFLRPWNGSEHQMPAMVLWGGRQDFCIAIDFNLTSMELEQDLDADGHFVLECVHNCSHSAPPFDVDMGETGFGPLWQFMFSHPYWLSDGESPYQTSGVPEDMPEWCGVGVGGSTPRQGECGPDQC